MSVGTRFRNQGGPMRIRAFSNSTGLAFNPSFPLTLPSVSPWLDGSDLTTLFQDTGLTTPVTTDAQTVKGWKDKSTSVNFTNSTGATWKNAIQNNRGIVRFTAASTQILAGSLTVNQPNTIVVIGQVTGTGAEQRFADSNTGRQVVGLNSSSQTEMFGGTGFTHGSTDRHGSFHCFQWIFNGASSIAYCDGTQDITTGNPGAGGIAGTLNLGSDGGGTFFTVDIAEMFISGAVLNAGQIAGVLAYSEAKWGTP